MLVYVVTAHRWGSLESHSYVCGVFDDKEAAELTAKKEMYWRAGKYDCMITTMKFNNTNTLDNDLVSTEWIKFSYADDVEHLVKEDYAKSLSHTF
jgi:hypothetical protein